MKKFLAIALVATALTSCGGGEAKEEATADTTAAPAVEATVDTAAAAAAAVVDTAAAAAAAAVDTTKKP